MNLIICCSNTPTGRFIEPHMPLMTIVPWFCFGPMNLNSEGKNPFVVNAAQSSVLVERNNSLMVLPLNEKW